MEQRNDGGPAFPIDSVSQNQGTGETTVHQSYGGMTLRDYFAAKAMQGLLANSEGVHAGSEPTEAALFSERRKSIAWDYARLCFDMADAMLKARDA